jgi:hypothetical protein
LITVGAGADVVVVVASVVLVFAGAGFVTVVTVC